MSVFFLLLQHKHKKNVVLTLCFRGSNSGFLGPVSFRYGKEAQGKQNSHLMSRKWKRSRGTDCTPTVLFEDTSPVTWLFSSPISWFPPPPKGVKVGTKNLTIGLLWNIPQANCSTLCSYFHIYLLIDYLHVLSNIHLRFKKIKQL